MPATAAELASMEDALRHLRHTWMPHEFRFYMYVNEDIVRHKLPELSTFTNAVVSSKLLADAVKATLDRDRAEPPAKCASAPISRLVRVAYMTATIRKTAFRGSTGRSAVAWVCRTRFEQAAHSHARLDSALLSKEFKQVVQGRRCNTWVLTGAAAAAGAAGLVQRFAALGVRIESNVLCGAARLCDAGVLDALCGQAVTPRDVGSKAWIMHTQGVGETLAECGDGGGALIWLSQLQQPPVRHTPAQQRQPPGRRWPPWYSLLLCQRAAACRQLRMLQFLLGTRACAVWPPGRILARPRARPRLPRLGWPCPDPS
ncbi:hypothetical protein JKP88DRAFT_254233 [Tribonema minus]|uniref:Uncharacterized protein n=1 Tax=Tribonema minus TaxID=303371 RepID=A0A835Z7H3_9STRA|nr:hypothetical protein JKP88DRAFT_254233 [Tribonema minus]